jgi:phospholipid/cholesterol/gamma-HCH transport system substrate-binding protein
MRQAISKHLRDFVAIVFLVVVAAGVAGYILSNQRFYLPKWVPLVGKDFFTLKGEFQTAQAVTPGQGQTVDIAGVKVGEVSNVDLKNGRGVVTMKIQRKYSKIYRNASILLRPKTGLKDMILELDPGTVAAGRIKDDGTIPVSETLPDVNLDEILAQLDGDTRDYLRILLGAGAEGLRGNGRTLSATFRRFPPATRPGSRSCWRSAATTSSGWCTTSSCWPPRCPSATPTCRGSCPPPTRCSRASRPRKPTSRPRCASCRPPCA